MNLPMAVFYAVIACWVVFAAIFLFRKRSPKTEEHKSAPASRWGIALQGLGFALVWTVRRHSFTPLVPMPRWVEIVAAIVTVTMAIASVWICLAAVRALGKQWAMVARITESHKLITDGPYRCVRNPIYLGMFGMLLATGLAVSRWWMIPIAAAIFLIGNAIRIHSEEKLLREFFGAEFDAYTRQVPAMFPRL
jgi:protein-S-isoprenylcysteine O-methyltransferase Ste14